MGSSVSVCPVNSSSFTLVTVPIGSGAGVSDPVPDPLPVGAEPDSDPVGGEGPDPDPVGGEGPVPPIPLDTHAHLDAPAPSPPFPDPDPAPPFPDPPVPGSVGSDPASFLHLATLTFPFLTARSNTYIPPSTAIPLAFPLHFLSQVNLDFWQLPAFIS